MFILINYNILILILFQVFPVNFLLQFHQLKHQLCHPLICLIRCNPSEVYLIARRYYPIELSEPLKTDHFLNERAQRLRAQRRRIAIAHTRQRELAPDELEPAPRALRFAHRVLRRRCARARAVEHSVRELALRLRLPEQRDRLIAHERNAEHIADRRSAVRVLPQHRRDERAQLCAVHRRNLRRRIALYRLCDQPQSQSAVRALQSAKLVQHTAERPHVRFVVVRFAAALLGREVVRSAVPRVERAAGAVDARGEAEVAEFDDAAVGDEEVARLHVAVYDLPVVDVLQREAHLHEPVDDRLFAEALLAEALRGYPLRKVAAASILHQNVETGAADNVRDVADDVVVVELTEYLNLLRRTGAFGGAHVASVDLFDDTERVVTKRADKIDAAVPAAADLSNALELLHWNMNSMVLNYDVFFTQKNE